MLERTVVLHKPDAVARGLVGQLTSVFEEKGLTLVGCKMLILDDAILTEHYSHLAERPFFPRLAAFMKQLPIVAQCWEGVDAVAVGRSIVGATNGRDAAPGTLRGRFSSSTQANLVHASDTSDGADDEMKRFFAENELFTYEHPLRPFLYSDDELD